MKKLIFASLALFLILALAACNERAKPTPDASIPPLSLRNSESGATISLGMAQEAVEALLGEGTPFDSHARFIKQMEAERGDDEEWLFAGAKVAPYPFEDFSYGKAENYIEICYLDGEVQAFSLSTEIFGLAEMKRSNWQDCHGISLNVSADLLRESYGEGYEIATKDDDGIQYAVLEYYFDPEAAPMEEYQNSAFMLLFFINETDGKILTLHVSDVSQKSGDLPYEWIGADGEMAPEIAGESENALFEESFLSGSE